MRPSSTSRRPVAPLALLAGGLLVTALTGCASPDAADDAAATPSPTASPTADASPSPEPTAEPTPTATPTPTAEPDPAAVALSATGVGDVVWDQADAIAALTAVLGPPAATEDFPVECGLEDTQILRWGGLSAGVQAGTLLSWQVDDGPLPAGVTLPSDIGLGAPLSQVSALPGALPPLFLDNYGVAQLEVAPPADGAGAESVFYWFGSEAPDSPVTQVIGRALLGCG